MKRTVLNFGAILVAFIIGIAINNACADSLEKMSDSEVRNLVARLQEEVNSLKSRVAELEGKILQVLFRGAITIAALLKLTDGALLKAVHVYIHKCNIASLSCA